jgi:hypothetical protein
MILHLWLLSVRPWRRSLQSPRCRSARAAERAAGGGRGAVGDPAAAAHRYRAAYVWVDVRPDEVTSVILNLVIGNSGPTVATNVRVMIDPPLPAIEQLEDSAQTAQDLLAGGIKSLPPGRTLVWPLGQGFNILASDGPHVHTLTIETDGPFGKAPSQVYPLDMSDWRGVMHRPVGSLHQVARAIEKLAGAIGHQELPGDYRSRRRHRNAAIASSPACLG